MTFRFAGRIAPMALMSILTAAPLLAQGQPTPSPPQPRVSGDTTGRARSVTTPLKVTVVLSRYQGDKRVSSMPYVMGVTAGATAPGPKSTLRMGTDVPVVMTVF